MDTDTNAKERRFTMTHFATKPGEAFDWKAFQKHLGLTDKEMETWRKDPKREKNAPIMCSPEIQDKTLVIEVVESHSCPGGMKVGDRLYFKGCGMLDPERSSSWCSKAMEPIIAFANMATVLMTNGIDGNKMYYDHFQCGDAGAKFGGYGHVIMKATVVDESV